MPVERVHCIRKLDRPATEVWSVLSGFDIGWHPFVTGCTVFRDMHGAVVREFRTSDGGRMVEQRTYVSDTDRVLCYTALSGIEGVLSYVARVEITEENGQCLITWHADIVAREDRVPTIAEGTKAVFEVAFDALATAPAKPAPAKLAQSASVAPIAGAIEGVPRLSYLTGPDLHASCGTLVLLLHGIGGQASNWSNQIAAFAGDYTIAAMNLRGYGDSTLGFSQTQIDDYCDDIFAMAKHFGADRLVLVGLSMGSWIATSFAMRHGDKMAGLVLAGGCTGMSEADPRERDNFRVSREVPLSQGQRPADFAGAVVNAIAGPNAPEAVRSALHRSMSDIPTETYCDALMCFCNPLERFDFSKLTCPVLMIAGEHDNLAPPEEIRRVSERIFDALKRSKGRADVRFEILADAGHVCNLEQPTAFNVLLQQFLARLPGVAMNYKPSRQEKQLEKRQRILAAAHVEFCDVGFGGASMDRLAKAADVSKPTLYQYFGDKEGLFAAVLDEGRAHITAPLLSREGKLVDRLWDFSWTYACFVLRPDMLSLARLILGEAGRRPQSAINYHQSGPARAFEGLTEFAHGAEAAGELELSDPKLAANDLWSLILSGPRDYYLHYVDERPTDAELCGAIGHGLKVFLKAYSCNPDGDQQALQRKIAAKRQQLAEEQGETT